MTQHPASFFATCFKGCEPFLFEELQRLALKPVKIGDQGVWFGDNPDHGYDACLWSRLASRVLQPLATFHASNRDDLYENTKAIAWEEHLHSHATFAVEGNGQYGEIRHSGYLALRVKDAMADKMRDKTGRRPDVNKDDPDIRVTVRLDFKGRCTLSLDLSGDSLHRRGYRLSGHKAPLKENLAAAILAAAGYTGQEPLLDPMCGSGTFLIEAAEWALGLAPGRRQTFGFERWPQMSRAAKRELDEKKREGGIPKRRNAAPIIGSDVQPKAVRLAISNCEHAGVGGIVRVMKRDARQITLPDLHTLLVANPPYGERMDPPEGKLLDLYEALGETWKGLGHFRAAMFCAHPHFRKRFSMKPYHVLPWHNGPLATQLYLYEVGRGWGDNPERRLESFAKD